MQYSYNESTSCLVVTIPCEARDCYTLISGIEKATNPLKKTSKSKSVPKLLSYVNAYGKPVYFPRAMALVITARKAGNIRSGNDWLPVLLANVERAKELQEIIRVSAWDSPVLESAKEEYRDIHKLVNNA